MIFWKMLPNDMVDHVSSIFFQIQYLNHNICEALWLYMMNLYASISKQLLKYELH